MKHWQIYACFVLIGAFVSGCWIQEAPVQKQKALCVAADFLTKEDSAVINRFALNYKVKVSISVLTPEAIIERCRYERYNAGIDVIITANKALRKQLQLLDAFKPVKDPVLFGKLDRQFNNKHHHWLPVSHDPLIVTAPKDTSSNCPVLNFSRWHRRDSLHPVVKISRPLLPEYSTLIATSRRLKWLNLARPPVSLSNERIYALSEFAQLEKTKDTSYNKAADGCRSYIIDNKRFITRTTTVSVYAHGRNHATAQEFVNVFFGNAYTVASGRNQLPVNKRIKPSWHIRSLSIR